MRDVNNTTTTMKRNSYSLKHFVFWNTMFNITQKNNTLTIAYYISNDNFNPKTNDFRTRIQHKVQIEPGFY
jgi:hypothetical protein